jgi:hypothetical protein
MATIELYADKINKMPGLIKEARQSVVDYKSELEALQKKALSIRSDICNMDDVISSIKASTQLQERKIDSLDELSKNCENFIADVVRIDNAVADLINQRKNEFLARYSYLKPDIEQSGWDKLCDGLKKTGDWCKEHWREILVTIVIIAGAVIAIAIIIGTGGVALAPIIAAGLNAAFGVAYGTALTIATGVSLFISTVAVTSTIASSTLNIIGTWCDMSGNETFQSWQTAMNWVALGSNLLYSFGNIYNSVKGVSGGERIARTKAIENGEKGYGNLSEQHPNVKIGEGKNFSKVQRNSIYNENARRNGGVIRDDVSGKQLVRQTGKGTKPLNGAEIDHIIPKSRGGSNSFSNARITNWETNLAKTNNLNFPLNQSIGGVKDIGNSWEAFGIAFVETFRNYANFRVGMVK